MRRQSILRGLLIIVLILFIAININGINSFLSFHTDKTVEFGHSTAVVPQAWNTTKEANVKDIVKTPEALTNEYIIFDHWDDWPEDHITKISEAKFKDMENGSYKVLKNDQQIMGGVNVSKQYFSNPSRNNNVTWTTIGVNYVFAKEDTNYTIQVHYFTNQDYNNTTFMKVVDDSVDYDISNIHNKDYNAAVSAIRHGFNKIVEVFPH